MFLREAQNDSIFTRPPQQSFSPALPPIAAQSRPGTGFSPGKAAGISTSEAPVFRYVEKAKDRERCWEPVSTSRLAGLGDPAAPKTFCLPLLPSGPGGVHRVLLHRAQPLKLQSCLSRRPLSQGAYPVAKNIYMAPGTSELGVAERVGFEPTVPLPRRMLSKHVDSSTLAPLRNIGKKDFSMWS
jgi:hypothetical protein